MVYNGYKWDKVLVDLGSFQVVLNLNIAKHQLVAAIHCEQCDITLSHPGDYLQHQHSHFIKYLLSRNQGVAKTEGYFPLRLLFETIQLLQLVSRQDLAMQVDFLVELEQQEPTALVYSAWLTKNDIVQTSQDVGNAFLAAVQNL